MKLIRSCAAIFNTKTKIKPSRLYYHLQRSLEGTYRMKIVGTLGMYIFLGIDTIGDHHVFRGVMLYCIWIIEARNKISEQKKVPGGEILKRPKPLHKKLLCAIMCIYI